MKVIGALFNLSLDISKGGIQIGNLNITTEEIQLAFSKLIHVAGIIVAMYLTIKIGCALIDKSVNREKKMRFSLDEKKSKTVGAVLKSILRYSVYFFGIFGLVEVFFGKVGLTFAGIGGLAIGFGSQSLVKDVINGFFILFEDQYSVGDYIHIDDKNGIVESIELRLTKLRDFNGDLHIIPNGMINKVTNHSRGNMRILLDVEIPYEEDLDKTAKIITEACEKFKTETEDMVEGPKVLGVSALKESSMSIRVVGKAKPMTQWDCEMKLRTEIKKALDKSNIKVPYPKRIISKED